jgi:hypothetical protein
MMSDHYKTVETSTEPSFIVTNDFMHDGKPKGTVLLGTYWYQGEDDEVPPKLEMDMDDVTYMGQEDIKRLISALQEFVE